MHFCEILALVRYTYIYVFVYTLIYTYIYTQYISITI